MSLRYRLFGSPGNIDEVVNRVHRTGEIPEVYAVRRNVGTLVPTAQRFEYTIGVRVGRTQVPVHRWEKAFEFFVEGLDNGRQDFVSADSVADGAAAELARELSSKGVTALYKKKVYYPAERSEP